MFSSWTDEENQINKYNGQYVMATLSSLGNKTTKKDLVKRFVSMTNQQHEAVDKELSRILSNGVNCGFIKKIGKEYILPTYRNGFEIDSGAGSCGKVTEDHEDSESEIDDEAEYLNQLEEMMTLSCRMFRSKLLESIIDVVMGQCKEANLEELKLDFANQIFHLSTIPVEHVDACTKSKLTEFLGSVFELIHHHDVRVQLLRYTVTSVDKWIMEHNLCTFQATKQQAIRRFINEVIQLEQGDCEKFRTVYVHHLLNKVIEALSGGAQFASELLMRLNLEDRCEHLSSTIMNLIHKAFVSGKSGNCPIRAYFKFLTDRRAKAGKASTTRKRKRK